MVQDLGLNRTADLPRRPARRSAIDPFIVMDVMREAHVLAAEGRDIVHMEVGQPGTPAPRASRERARQALEVSSSATPMPWASGRSANASRVITGNVTASACRRNAS
jgi:hypothetical protein